MAVAVAKAVLVLLVPVVPVVTEMETEQTVAILQQELVLLAAALEP